MWPIVLQFLRANSRYIALPFAAVVGFIGFNLETYLRSPEDISSKQHNPKQTIYEARTERQITTDLNSPDHGVQSPKSVLKYRSDPIFDKNK